MCECVGACGRAWVRERVEWWVGVWVSGLACVLVGWLVGWWVSELVGGGLVVCVWVGWWAGGLL